MLNHITIMGRLTADPELRRTDSGIPVARKFPGQVEVHRRGNRVFLQRGTPSAKEGGKAND